MSTVAHFTKDQTVEQAFKTHAGAKRVFARFHLGGCSHCSISETETIEQVSEGYGIPLALLMADLEKLFERARRARLPYDRNILLNTAFFLNYQYVEWHPATSQIRQIPRPKEQPNVPRPVSNKVQHFVLQEHSMSLNTRPTADVLPADSDPMAISNANVLLAYLNWLASEQVADFDGVLSRATLWALAAGEGWVKWTWDPTMSNGADKPKGRGDISSPSPLDVFPDPYAQTFDKARYLFHRQFMDVEQVFDIYGVTVQPQEVASADPNRAMLMAQMGMAVMLEGAPVTEYWAKPSRRHPDGLFASAGYYFSSGQFRGWRREKV